MTRQQPPPTYQLLIERYGKLHLNIDDLSNLMDMTQGSILTAISADRFPIRTFKMGKNRVSDVRDVADWIDEQRGAA